MSIDRRRVLRALGGCSLFGISGCLGRDPSATERDTKANSSDTKLTDAETTLAGRGDPATICETDIRYNPGITPIVTPAFDEDWTSVSQESSYIDTDRGDLADETTVIGIEHKGVARAYPVPLLTSHEIVNDTIAPISTADADQTAEATPIIVTYCPLCRSGLVAERVVRGQPTEFYVSGRLWTPPQLTGETERSVPAIAIPETGSEQGTIEPSGNLVMYDEATKSFWSQLLATAICGPMAGEELSMLTATTATWEDWRTEHPTGSVLLPPPASKTTRTTN